MKEKTLLYSALTATALAAAYGVYRGHQPAARIEIAPVSLSDSSRPVAHAEVPIRLTASDGTGLRLAAVKASGAIEDPLALTELHLTFENPEDRVLEGTFQITLPQGASLSRFAMKVGDTWQEGEVVEKQAARRAYEDFLHRRQDPALMEQAGGNEFTARVFPIPARGKKEIVVAYSEVLEAGAPYTVPLHGLPMLGSLDIDVRANGRSDGAYALHQSQVTPAGDFVVEARNIPRSAGLRNGDLAMMRVVPFTSSRPEPLASAVVLVDTSASRALGLDEQARLVQRVLGKLPGDTKVVVACFDQEVVPLYDGTAGGFGEREVSSIVARGALGASDFEAALAWAGDQAKKTKAKRVVVVGDGVATAGETDGQKLKAKVEALRSSGVERIDAIAVGGIRDDGFLRGLVRGVLDRDGVVLDAKLGPEALARRLGEATSSGVAVKVDDATWSWPKNIDGLQAGDEVIVYAQVAPEKPVRVQVGTQSFAQDLRSIDRPLLERAWAQAKIASLVEAPTEDPATTKKQIVALSTRHRVLSPHTAMLVLETDDDYRRFGIDRTANVDILSVRDGRVAVVQGGRDGWMQEKLRDQKQTAVLDTTVDTPAAPEPPSTGEADKNAEERGDLLGALGTKNKGAGVRGGGGAPAQAQAPVPMPRRLEPADEGERAKTEAAPKPARRAPMGAGKADLGGSDDETRKALEALQKAQLESDRDGFADPAPAPPPPPATPRPLATATSAPVPTPAPRPAENRPALRPRGPATTPGVVGSALVTGATGNVRQGALVVQGGISQDEAMRVVRSALPQMRACYIHALQSNPTLRGDVSVQVTIDRTGGVKSATATRGAGDPRLDACALGTLRALHFPAPGTMDASFSTSFDFVPAQGAPVANTDEPPSPFAGIPQTQTPQAAPYEGRFKVVMDHLARGDKDAAFAEANKWRAEQPGDVMALVALGEVMEAKGEIRTAARAYGSILELFSARADSRRFAGERLERLKDAAALRLAADTYGKAAEQRPDHPASHRLYAFTLLKLGEHEKAFEAMRAGVQRRYPPGRFAGVERILSEDLGLIAAAWMRAQPNRAGEIEAKLRTAGGAFEQEPSLRFVLVWETDANDVDFHIYDARGGHAYYSNRDLPSGGSLYADVTTGYGPECFTIRGARERRAYPYTLQAHYYSRGPMGYGMGKLEIVEHDGHGNLTFEERPFVVMQDRAYVDLGTVDRDRPATTALLK